MSLDSEMPQTPQSGDMRNRAHQVAVLLYSVRTLVHVDFACRRGLRQQPKSAAAGGEQCGEACQSQQ